MIDRGGRAGALAIAIAAAMPPAAQDADAMMARGRALTAADPCRTAPDDTIVVCGRADAARRHRLPLPRAPTMSAGDHPAAELLNEPGECGPFGRRRCSKREAAAQGFGGGRDPLTLATRLAARMLGSDD